MISEITKERFFQKVLKTDYCWVWLASKNNIGYGKMKVDGSIIKAHRLSWIIHTGQIISKTDFICHKCDNPRCVNPQHLFLGNAKTNMNDCSMKGRTYRPIGSKNVKCILSEHDVVTIRSIYTGKKGDQKNIAKMFGVNSRTICNIINRVTWKHI